MYKCNVFDNNSTRQQVEAKLFWSNKIILDGNLNPQEKMKRNRNMINSTVNVTNSMNIYLFFFFALAPLKDITLYKVIIIII